MSNILIPDPKLDERPGHVSEELYKQWRVEKDATEPEFIRPNIRFVHDPEWREHWLSMEAARTQRHIIWKITSTLFLIAQFWWTFLTYLATLN